MFKSNKKMNYTKLRAIKILKEGEDYISSDEWLQHARAITKGTMNQEAYDFYAREENWHLLPDDTEFLYFADTEFLYLGGDRYVRCLGRSGAEWDRRCSRLSDRFSCRCRVAALASSPQNFEPKTSLESFNPSLEDRVQKLEEWRDRVLQASQK